jgi:hypothetical protein
MWRRLLCMHFVVFFGPAILSSDGATGLAVHAGEMSIGDVERALLRSGALVRRLFSVKSALVKELISAASEYYMNM